MQMLIMSQPVRKSWIQILCQALLFDNRLPVAAVLNQRSVRPNLSPARGVCQNSVATATKHSKATPLHGLQTQISSCKFYFFSLFNSWKNDVLMFSQIVCSFFSCSLKHEKDEWAAAHSSVCLSVCLPACLPAFACVWKWLARPGLALPTAILNTSRSPQLHFVSTSSSVLNLNLSKRLILLTPVNSKHDMSWGFILGFTSPVFPGYMRQENGSNFSTCAKAELNIFISLDTL